MSNLSNNPGLSNAPPGAAPSPQAEVDHIVGLYRQRETAWASLVLAEQGLQAARQRFEAADRHYRALVGLVGAPTPVLVGGD